MYLSINVHVCNCVCIIHIHLCVISPTYICTCLHECVSDMYTHVCLLQIYTTYMYAMSTHAISTQYPHIYSTHAHTCTLYTCMCMPYPCYIHVCTSLCIYICTPSVSICVPNTCTGEGNSTPVLLPGKSQGQRSLVGCSPWGRTESDMTERLHRQNICTYKICTMLPNLIHGHPTSLHVFICIHIRVYPMAPQSSTLAWKIQWMEEPGRL